MGNRVNQNVSAGVRTAFNLDQQVVVITGGAGLLGIRHAQVVAELGGTPVIVDLDQERVTSAAEEIVKVYGGQAVGLACDITHPESVENLKNQILEKLQRVNVLINNAANNPKVAGSGLQGGHWSRLENFPLSAWQSDLDVGLTGAFLCSRVFGQEMAREGRGVILNIASDLGLIAPDQRIYRQEGLSEEMQPVKPVTYSVVKAGLIGLTRYLATYWAKDGVRVNALAPGGVEVDQDPAFIKRLTHLIPMGRMASKDEYKGVVAFMISDASSYMTGAVLSVDGGRTAW
ncbi:MAG: SDR family oxidoreductase [Magnetococcales bacterium]|nr:SDR family oxidoreductase [Magnetococcales bacterium]